MVNQVPFGRRGLPPRPPRRISAPVDPDVQRQAAGFTAVLEPAFEPRPTSESPSIERELRDWKRERKRHSQLPWRQLSFMATLCFGIAAFALPSSVNGAVQWVLYALMAMSAYTAFRRRHP